MRFYSVCQPMSSSSVKGTAAIGVLNAAASAAEVPTGMSAFNLPGLNPDWRPNTEAMLASAWTEEPS
jgi:hypothetical protein